MLLTDRNFGTTSSMMRRAAATRCIYQHLFWFFGHPEVYIMILPGFGIVSHDRLDLQRASRSSATSRMAYAMVAIGVVGFIVWAHHMYTVGMSVNLKAYFAAATMVIAVPTGVKIFSVDRHHVGRLHRASRPRCSGRSASSSSSPSAASPASCSRTPASTTQLHDTYYVVAHFHYVLSLGAVFTLFCRLLLLVPEDVRAASTASFIGRSALLDLIFVGVEPHLLPPALPRPAGHAAPLPRLCAEAYPRMAPHARRSAMCIAAAAAIALLPRAHPRRADPPASKAAGQSVGRGRDDPRVDAVALRRRSTSTTTCRGSA
jgi:cytochrome c oxidase subunit 1